MNEVLQQLLFFGLLVFGLYLLLIRPQRARARAQAQVQEAVVPGARVVTTAGIHATVVAKEEGDMLVLEIAPGVHVRFVSAAVVRILDTPASPDAAGEGAA